MKIKSTLLFLMICIAALSFAQTKKPIKKKVNKPITAIKRELLPEPIKEPKPSQYGSNADPGMYLTEAPRSIGISLANGKTIAVYKISEIADVDFKIIKRFSLNNRYTKNVDEAELSTLISKVFNEAEQLEELELRNAKLKSLPEITRLNTSLKKLSVSENELEDLPIGFEKLVNLEELNIDGNKFKVLPNSLTKLKKLTSISMEKNPLSVFPNQLFEIPSLKAFYIYKSDIAELPNNFNKLPNLTEVVIQSTKISTLPSSFALLTKLKSIALEGNQFKDYPASILALKSLYNVNLSNNPIDKALFFKSIANIKWRGLFAIYDINFTKKDYEAVRTKLKLIDVYY
ncbi:leucine-rich repeat domain-containing protein [Pedobacter sp. SL55]|uniref:leucine-rich repeat domain-containing protein n=1 Tax=Pedobacter sp. SL55 TaxID=2995161 RepID=UPI002271459F|nr:leucine-rich repeat domain-containing protein [Pedobacter sp. SL55]WAC42584.1 hypothetical protein OVA16_09580 [Pedobacter sp. SL55]